MKNNPALFYDSLQVRASRHKLTKWLYGRMICVTGDSVNKDLLSYEYYHGFENRTIGSIRIKSLEVFGPDFYDTAKVTNIGIEKFGNKLHSKSNLNVIRRNLWIREGQQLDPNLIMDNERLLRSLPYLKDVRFILTPRPENENLVDILILTKDVFSFGLSGSISNINKGNIGIYDKNILGIGHEIGFNLVGHTEKTPNLGFEAYYAVNNFEGNFVNFAAGYANNYLREGFYINFGRDFLRPQSVYAGGLTVLRSFRSNQINLNDYVTSEVPVNFLFLDAWYGRRIRIGINPNDSRFQINLSGRVRYTHFYSRPFPEEYNNQYFANSKFYLGSLSFSRRNYIRDYLIYSYGITEDIPKGYLHELVFGFDHNEFGDRWYSHLFLSTGNIFNMHPFYFYTSLGVGSFWKPKGLEQGIVDMKMNFISPLFEIWNMKARQFIKLNYTLGINRLEVEDLLLRNGSGIRGFASRIGKGKQRLALNIENVFFQNKSILNFKSAFFTFFDLGLIGDPDRIIFRNDYYAGLGVGLRIRNENLIFKTIQLRLAFYPYHPSDVSAAGFMLDEISRSRFYSFQPRGPEPLRFE
ncbi:MAG: hypothetical protein WAO52_16335 [Prolixibacteraceae bacterium]